MTQNVYIHIPFCKSKCKYCSFVSMVNLKDVEGYINALIKQIKECYKGELIDTLYIGGGTPSLLELCYFEQILSLFNFSKNPEITCEVNPESVNLDFLIGLKQLGINRLSIGSQSFNDDILKKIGRLHSAGQIVDSVSMANEAGLANISLDLIYGLPDQSVELFRRDILSVLGLGVSHVSLYGLKIEEGCVFYNDYPKNIADSDTQADMFLLAIDELKKAGFIHYEVSNFAKPGFESRHNKNYWANNSYYGFGLAASGYENGIRYTNTDNLQTYLKNPFVKIEEHKLTQAQQLEESIFLGLRMIDGIDVAKINKTYSINFVDKYSQVLAKYMPLGYIVKTPKGFALSKRGILVSNEILADFLD